jgi:hypothetical protein
MDAISRVANNEKQLGGCTGKGFMPGKSGNPSGRPKKLAVSEVFEEILKDPATREQIKQQTIQTLTSRGMAGVLLLREVAERLEGKVTQGIELSGSISTMTDEQVDERLTKLLDLDLKQHEVIEVTEFTAFEDKLAKLATTDEPERDSLTTK